MTTPTIPQTPYSPPPGPPKKPHHPVRWAFGIFGGLLALILAIAIPASMGGKTTSGTTHHSSPPAVSNVNPSAPPQPSSPPPPPQPSGPPVLAVGDSEMISNESDVGATVTIDQVVTSTHPADMEFGDAPVNGIYVSAHVVVTADKTGSGTFSVNPFDFYAKVNGTHYEYGNGNAVMDAPHNDITIDDTQLAAGESVSGWLTFDLPSSKGQIAYAPNYGGEPICFWRIGGPATVQI